MAKKTKLEIENSSIVNLKNFDKQIKKLTQNGKTLADIQRDLGFADGLVSGHCNHSKNISFESAVAYSHYFGVSLDYLIGDTETETIKTDIRMICDYTGLSEKAIDVLHGLVENSSCTQISLFNDTFSTLSIINSFFENGNDAFFKKIFEFKYESEKSLNVLLGYLNRTFTGTTAYEDMKLSYLYLQVMDTFKETLDSIVPNYQKYEELKSENSAYLKKCADEIEEIFKSFEIKVGENNEQG